MGATTDKIKGKAMKAQGRMTGDRARTATGQFEEAKGKLKSAVKRGVRKAKRVVRRARIRTGIAKAKAKASR